MQACEVTVEGRPPVGVFGTFTAILSAPPNDARTFADDDVSGTNAVPTLDLRLAIFFVLTGTIRIFNCHFKSFNLDIWTSYLQGHC